MSATLFDTAIGFFAELEQNNDRQWWAAERVRYDDVIRPGFVALCEHIGGFGSFRVYRPYNDVRFRADGDPFKTFIGGVAERADGVGLFVQISARGLLLGSGIPQPAADQLPRLRAAIAADDTGAAFQRAVDGVVADGVRVHGGRWPALKRTPAGVPADHPRAEYLRWKGVEANTRVAQPQWSSIADAAAAIGALVERAEPIHEWLGRCVGPSSLTPEERFAPKRR